MSEPTDTPGPLNDSMDRRGALRRIGGLGLSALLGSLGLGASGSADPPNIIFFLSDDHTEKALSCYGSDYISTPNIDRLADEGARFENSFVTNSLCAPARASMLTGQYAHKHGKIDNRGNNPFDDSLTTFPELLGQNGYHNELVGKWHLQGNPSDFDRWLMLVGGNQQGRYFDPRFASGTFDNRTQEENLNGYVTDIITDQALRRLRFLPSQSGDGPFCLFCWHKAPHRPFAPPPRYTDAFDDADLPPPPTLHDDYEDPVDVDRQADMRLYGSPFESDSPFRFDNNLPQNASPREGERIAYERFMRDYLGAVKAVDDGVGRILDYLDESGLAENTLVVYAGDNGFFLGEHGWLDKRFMYDESMGIPLLARLPDRIPAGRVIDDFALDVDFAQTFLDYGGVSATDEMEGRSLRPLLEDDSPPDDWRTSAYYHFYENYGPHNVAAHYGVRTARYELIHYYRRGNNQQEGSNMDAWELFDLQRDPNETTNRYGDPEYEDVVESLKRDLQSLREQYGDDNGPAVTVDAEVPSAVKDLEVHAPYPNPFSDGTTLEVVLPAASHVRATVYDVLGRRVTTLMDERQPPGRVEVRWDGEQEGEAGDAPAGAYVIRVEAGGEQRSRRVVRVN